MYRNIYHHREQHCISCVLQKLAMLNLIVWMCQCTYVSVWFESTAAGSNSEYSQLFCIPTVRGECLACTDTFLNQNELRVYCVYCIWHSAAPSSVRTGFPVKESSITCPPVNACSPFQRSNRVCRIWSIERTSD